jgi:hypothetical protein
MTTDRRVDIDAEKLERVLVAVPSSDLCRHKDGAAPLIVRSFYALPRISGWQADYKRMSLRVRLGRAMDAHSEVCHGMPTQNALTPSG